MPDIVRVLIVDDSAFVRKVLRQILSKSPFLEVVGAARDGVEAMELIEQLNPDVVTLDLNMPRGDGLMFLKAQMAKKPLPILVVSMASKDGQQVLEALEAGAVDACAESLVNLKDAACTSLRKGLGEASLDVRRAIVDVCARIRTKAAIELAESAQSDSDAAVRHAALTALAHIRTRPATVGSPSVREARP